MEASVLSNGIVTETGLKKSCGPVRQFNGVINRYDRYYKCVPSLKSLPQKEMSLSYSLMLISSPRSAYGPVPLSPRIQMSRAALSLSISWSWLPLCMTTRVWRPAHGHWSHAGNAESSGPVRSPVSIVR